MKQRIGCWAGALAVAVTLASAAARTQTRTPAFDVVEKSIIELQSANGRHGYVAAARRAVSRAHRGLRSARARDQRVSRAVSARRAPLTRLGAISSFADRRATRRSSD